jgi:hypothetical protein
MVRKSLITPKRLSLLLLILIGLMAKRHFSPKEEKGFSLAKIASSLPFDPRYATPPPTAEQKLQLQEIFSQRFDYLGGGAESFCFVSEDGHYVIKFFKMAYFLPKPWIQMFPFYLFKTNLLSHYWERRSSRLPRTFAAHRCAYEELQEQTGVIFAHLNKTNSWQHAIRVRDEDGKEFLVPLDTTEFVLQKRAVPAFQYIKACLQKTGEAGAERALTALFEMIAYRLREGWIDLDKGISTNYGFIDGKPVQIDLGHLEHDPKYATKEVYCAEILRVHSRLAKWARTQNPALVAHVNREKQRLYGEWVK